mmetsp:Transcript_7526/g.21316  ORF Transcript_7526/g.21316 Transcript_7526/m.21316 type:complete len:920 (+) Transcript_7526:297-3056(+)
MLLVLPETLSCGLSNLSVQVTRPAAVGAGRPRFLAARDLRRRRRCIHRSRASPEDQQPTETQETQLNGKHKDFGEWNGRQQEFKEQRGGKPKLNNVHVEAPAILIGGSLSLGINSASESCDSASESGSVISSSPPSNTMFVAPPPHISDKLVEDVSGMTLHELTDKDMMYNVEMSWLSFNWRVIFTAQQPNMPLWEQLKFLAISMGNLDEFFAKRVGGLMRQRLAGVANLTGKKPQGLTPNEQLALISSHVKEMVQFVCDDLYSRVLPQLQEAGIWIVEYHQLSKTGVEDLEMYFSRQVEVLLTPIKLDPGHPFPVLPSDSLNIAVLLEDPKCPDSPYMHAIVNIPCNLPRWHPISSDSTTLGDSLLQGFVLLEEIVINNLSKLFGGMTVVGAHTFRVTRNAELERHEEDADDLLDMISYELRERRFAPFVRLQVHESMPENLARLICGELQLCYEEEVFHLPGMLSLADLISIPVDKSKMDPSMLFSPGKVRPHPRLAPTLVQRVHRRQQADWGGNRWKGIRSIFSVIRQADLLVHHPYQSFSSSTQRLVEEAARDPDVVAIKATLYRTSSDSPIISALQKAAEAGKQVAVLVELKARFDEARNVGYARRLEDAGCNVAYGLVGLKTHCKTLLVVRREKTSPHGLRPYVHIGTGNYNPSTARTYTDFGLLTCDPDICSDVVDLFKYLTGMHDQRAVGGYRRLLVANTNMRSEFVRLIEAEIDAAKAGHHAAITIKTNGLDDKRMVRLLHEAAAAGVRVDCIVRGVCSLRPGVPGLTDNLRVVSIVGRYLEHHRVYCFHNRGDPKYYIGSADWMSRNLSRRVEVAAPILNEDLKRQLHEVLALCLFDRVNAWDMLPNGRYVKPAFRTDESITSAPFLPGEFPQDLKKMADRVGCHTAILALTKAEVDRAFLTTKKRGGA